MGKSLKGKELGAGFAQRADGMYLGYFMFNGKQQNVYAKTLKECKEKYQKKKEELENGLTGDNPTLQRVFDSFIDDKLTQKKVKGSTVNNYKQLYNLHIKPEFGAMRVKNIKPIMVKNFQQKLCKKYEPRTVNSLTDLLHNILEYALDNDIIGKNPAKKLHVSDDQKHNPDRNNNRALTEEEERIFKEYAKESFYYNAVCLLFATGMRAGELRALRWSDYDKENGVLHIRHTASVDENNKLCMNTPKSRDGLRDIPLNDEIIDILERQRKQQREMNGTNVLKFDGLIFTSVTGKVISRNVLKSAFNIICEHINKAGIPFDRISPHACRHTFITRSLHAGANIYDVRGVVGHAMNARVTEAVYCERDLKAEREFMQKRSAI